MLNQPHIAAAHSPGNFRPRQRQIIQNQRFMAAKRHGLPDRLRRRIVTASCVAGEYYCFHKNLPLISAWWDDQYK